MMQRLPNIGSTPGEFDRHSKIPRTHASMRLYRPSSFPDSVLQLAGRGSYGFSNRLTRTAVRLQSDLSRRCAGTAILPGDAESGPGNAAATKTLHAYVVCAALTDCRVKRDKREHDSSDSRPIEDTLQHLPRTLRSCPHVHLAHVAGLSRCNLGIAFWNVTWGGAESATA